MKKLIKLLKEKMLVIKLFIPLIFLLFLEASGAEKRISITDIIPSEMQDVNSLDKKSKSELIKKLLENKDKIESSESDLFNFFLGILLYEQGQYDSAYQYLTKNGSKNFSLRDYREFYSILSQVEMIKKNEANIDIIENLISSLSHFNINYPESILKGRVSEKIAVIEKRVALMYAGENNPSEGIHFLSRALARTSDKSLKRDIRIIMANLYIVQNNTKEGQNIVRALLYEGVKREELIKISKENGFKITFLDELKIDESREVKNKNVISGDLYKPDQAIEIFNKFKYHFENKNYVVLPVLLKEALSKYRDRARVELIGNFNESFERILELSYSDKNYAPIVNEYINTFTYYDSGSFIKFVDEIIKKSFYEETLRLLLSYLKRYPAITELDKLKYYIARLYEDTESLDDSLNYYEQIILGHPESQFFERALFKKGWILYRKGDFTESLSLFLEYINQQKYEEFKTPSYYYAAKSYEGTGKIAESKKIYEELVKNYPVTFYAIIARMKLGISMDSIFQRGNEPEAQPNLGRASGRTQIILSKNEDIGDSKSKDVAEPIEYTFEDQVFIDKAIDLIKCHLLSFAKAELERVVYVNKPASFNLTLSKLNSLVQNYQRSLVTAKYIKNTADYSITKKTAMLLYPLYYQDIIRKCNKTEIDEYFILSLINQESLFQKDVASSANAIGLMQLILETARRESLNPNLTLNDLKNPEINIDTGIKYLANLLKRFDGNLAYVLAAYNAGEHNVERWLAWGKGMDIIDFVEAIPYKETRGYVKIVMSNYLMYNYLYENREFKSVDEWFNLKEVASP